MIKYTSTNQLYHVLPFNSDVIIHADNSTLEKGKKIRNKNYIAREALLHVNRSSNNALIAKKSKVFLKIVFNNRLERSEIMMNSTYETNKLIT